MSDGKYIDVFDYYDLNYPFQAFIGGRATGKTFSALKGCVERSNIEHKFTWMRRTDKESKILCDSHVRGEGANPFKNLNKKYGWNYGFVPIMDGMSGVFERKFEKGKSVIVGDQIGYGVGLTTVSSIRGIDMSDTDITVYDEFIPERHVKAIKAEGEAFLNAVETIGRNRELEGEKPMCVFLLANAFNIANAIFMELGVVDVVEKAVNNRQEHIYLPNKGLAIHLLKNTEEFNRLKKQTALGKLTKGTRFSDMAYNNEFIYNDFSLIGWRSVKGYKPIIGIGDFYLWQSKGRQEFYFTYAQGRCPVFDPNMVHNRREFLTEYGNEILNQFIYGNVKFETYAIKEKVLDILGL